MKTNPTRSARALTYLIAAFFLVVLVVGNSQPRAHAQDAEERVTMNFDNAKWSDVFDWCVDRSGKPFVSRVPPPPGQFSHATPQGHKYTMLEAAAIINESLMKQDHVLVRRPQSWTLVRIAK
jgi:hypothetical protein